MPKFKDEPYFPNCNLILYGKGVDTNGNKIVKVGFPNERAFSIQTNGTLPETHHILGVAHNEVSEDELEVISEEVCSYVKEHGSKAQKAKLKIYNKMAKGGNVSGKDRNKMIYDYIINCIDSGGYDVKTETDAEKIKFVWDTFMSEYGSHISYYKNWQKTFENWLQGLPSSFNVDYENHEIIEIGKKWGILKPDATEKQEDKFLETWWARIYMGLRAAARKNKVELSTSGRMAKGGSVPDSDIEEFVNGYKRALLFATNDIDTDESFDSKYNLSDFAPETDKKLKKMASEYISENKQAIDDSGMDLSSIGGDVFYAQAGHGAGFFDHSLDKDVEDKLTAGAEKYGDLIDIEAGDDGLIRIRGGRRGFFGGGGNIMAKGGNIPSGTSGRYLGLHPTKNGLKVVITEEGKEELRAHEVEGEEVYLEPFIYELMDDIQGNSEWRYHSNLGDVGLGMTDAPGFTDGYEYNDDGEFESSHDDSAVYYYNNYAIKDFARELLDNGEVFFNKADKMAKGGSVNSKIATLERMLESKTASEELKRLVRKTIEKLKSQKAEGGYADASWDDGNGVEAFPGDEFYGEGGKVGGAERNKMIYQYVIDHIDADGYDEDPKTDAEKIKFLWKTFKSEYGWAIQRMGPQKAFTEWLSGLPSSFSVDYYNSDIVEIGKKWGILKPDATERQEDKFIETWWARIFMGVRAAARKNKVELSTAGVMKDGGAVDGNEEYSDLISKIKSILDKEIPGFWTQVKRYRAPLGGDMIAIKAAAKDYEINRVEGQRPQAVSLSLNPKTWALQDQVFGGNGGRRVYLIPDKNDAKEKYLAMAGRNVAFRTPQKNEKAVLSAIQKFFHNYKTLLSENKDRLMYKEHVDYDQILAGKMAKGGLLDDEVFKETHGNATYVVGVSDNGGYNTYIRPHGYAIQTIGNHKTKELAIKKIKALIKSNNSMGSGGKVSIGDNVHITDNKSLFKGKSGVITGESGKRAWMVKVLVDGKDRTVIVSKSGAKIIESHGKGGSVQSAATVCSDINDSYSGAHASPNRDGRIVVTSKFFNDLREIKHKYFNDNAIQERNDKGEYVLISNGIFRT